jgi:hypothetical protein
MNEYYQSLTVYSQIKKWNSWILGIKDDYYIESGKLMLSAGDNFIIQNDIQNAKKCFKLYIAICKEYLDNTKLSIEDEDDILDKIDDVKTWLSLN